MMMIMMINIIIIIILVRLPKINSFDPFFLAHLLNRMLYAREVKVVLKGGANSVRAVRLNSIRVMSYTKHRQKQKIEKYRFVLLLDFR